MENDINLHIVLVQAIIRNGDKFLMAKRASNDKQAGGQWAFPGGKCDYEFENNILEETIRKEIREEVGVEIQDKFVYLGSRSFIRSSGHHVTGITFLVDYHSGEAQPLEDQDEVKWLTFEEMNTIITSKDSKVSYLAPILENLKLFI